MFINPFQNHGDRDKICHHIHHHSQTVPSSHTGEWTDNMIHSDLLQVLFCPSTTTRTKHLGTSTSSKVVQSFLIFEQEYNYECLVIKYKYKYKYLTTQLEYHVLQVCIMCTVPTTYEFTHQCRLY